MDGIGNNQNIWQWNLNGNSAFASGLGAFAGRVVSQLEGAGKAFCNLISSLWDKITSLISGGVGNKSLSDQEVSNLQGMAQRSSGAQAFKDLATELEGVGFDQLKQILTAQDEDGFTPLTRVARYVESLEVFVPLLKQLKPDQLAELCGNEDDLGGTLLRSVAKNSRCLLIFSPLLRKLKPDQLAELIGRQNMNGTTPLHQAICSLDFWLVNDQLLQGLNADQLIALLGVQDVRGHTPLHYAARNAACLEPLVPRLFQNSLMGDQFAALLMVKEAEGETPLHVAATSAQRLQAFVPLLEKLTPDQTIALLGSEDVNGHTPLHVAAKNECLTEIAPLLKKMKRAQIAAASEG